MNIPFVDLYAQYQSIKEEIDETIHNVLEDTAFIRGQYVNKFESTFANDYGVKNCIPVANGTDALYIALKMLGIGPGDEVITTAHSWISTSETITQTGATPVFVDVDEYYNIDTGLIEERITSKTKCLLPVHLYGQPVNMTRIMELANIHDLFVVEDCAQAHYATWQGQRVGTFGNAGTFSFYPGKNLGAYGDAGAIVTNNDRLAKKMRMYANHGALKKHVHKMEGINSRMDGLQAAILTVKLQYIHEWTDNRQKVASWYDDFLEDSSGIEIPKVRDGAEHVYHLYVIRVDNREEVSRTLTERGVQSSVHYPVPLPLMEAYQYLGHTSKDFPVVSSNRKKILSLPIYPELNHEQVKYIVGVLEEMF